MFCLASEGGIFLFKVRIVHGDICQHHRSPLSLLLLIVPLYFIYIYFHLRWVFPFLTSKTKLGKHHIYIIPQPCTSSSLHTYNTCDYVINSLTETELGCIVSGRALDGWCFDMMFLLEWKWLNVINAVLVSFNKSEKECSWCIYVELFHENKWTFCEHIDQCYSLNNLCDTVGSSGLFSVTSWVRRISMK
jgi:hypothetical protein